MEGQRPSDVHGDHSANVSYKYEGVLKVISRSKAT